MKHFSKRLVAALTKKVSKIHEHIPCLYIHSVRSCSPCSIILLKNKSNRFYQFKILLVSGDIELNPGPQEDKTSMAEISICHINVRSIKAKYNGIDLKIDLIRNEVSHIFDIITISETWLTDNDDLQDFLIESFQPPFVLNRAGLAGGVLCWVKNCIAAKRRTDMEVTNLEALWLEIRCHN